MYRISKPVAKYKAKGLKSRFSGTKTSYAPLNKQEFNALAANEYIQAEVCRYRIDTIGMNHGLVNVGFVNASRRCAGDGKGWFNK